MRPSLIRTAGLVLGALTTLPAALAGPGLQTPYDAEVVADDATVRSGNTRQCYPTATLERGQRVRVHRHDYGGWLMIAPPEGSFSWIRADYIQRAGHRGTVTQNNVVVWVGSRFGDEHTVEQVRLSSGDTVEIVGEKTLGGGSAPQLYYQIKPPQNEYRWIEGKHVVPVDPAARVQHDQNPFAVPSNARRPEPAAPVPTPIMPTPVTPDAPPQEPQGRFTEMPSEARGDWQVQKPTAQGPALDRPVVRAGDGVRRNAPPEEVLDATRGRLKELDDRFREIIARDPRAWDLTQLESDYRTLHDNAAHPALKNQIALRFPAVERYKKVKVQYDELVRLTTETSRRDAELAAKQREAMQQATAIEPTPTKPDGTPAEPKLQPKPEPVSETKPITGPVLQAPEPLTTPAPSRPAVRQAVPKFDGAGIIRRAPRNYGPIRHVLVAPNGRVLAFLQAAPGVDLDRHVGQSMGLTGRRTRRPDLRTDHILVRGLTPVRLSR